MTRIIWCCAACEAWLAKERARLEHEDALRRDYYPEMARARALREARTP